MSVSGIDNVRVLPGYRRVIYIADVQVAIGVAPATFRKLLHRGGIMRPTGSRSLAEADWEEVCLWLVLGRPQDSRQREERLVRRRSVIGDLDHEREARRFAAWAATVLGVDVFHPDIISKSAAECKIDDAKRLLYIGRVEAMER